MIYIYIKFLNNYLIKKIEIIEIIDIIGINNEYKDST